jgi:hypothetical protein
MENLGSAIVELPCQSWSIQGIARHVKRPGGFWQTSQNRRACWRGLQPIHFPRPLIFGRYVGHSGILHGCTVKDEVLVGMGSIIHDDAVIGERSIIGAGGLGQRRHCHSARRWMRLASCHAIPIRDAPAALQVAEPPQPAPFDDVETVLRTLENVGDARSPRGGNIPKSGIAPAAQTCMK